MKNRDLYRQDPLKNDLLNNGVAAVTGNDDDTRVLQYELTTFVCEGEYAKGQKVSDAQMEQLNIEHAAVCAQWNYTLRPRAAGLSSS